MRGQCRKKEKENEARLEKRLSEVKLMQQTRKSVMSYIGMLLG